MDIEAIFSDLESNKTHKNEESKKKLVELFTQTKETWVVHLMLEYFVKTGSARIMDVLVKAQVPHDTYILDRLDDWLKNQPYRIQALNVFCFIVRRHPSWLFQIEKHRLIKSIFKLLTHEKDIVPLMSALLCIITLLPIIPNSVPNFLNDLFEVFGHLASWKLQNPNRLPDEKLVHLQLGLQMLFHRLYGMYPSNFLTYLSDFIKKDKGGGIFQHTIKPLLYTVRLHPMLLTASPDTELSNTRWKEMEPHDVVMECAHLALPVVHSDLSNEENTLTYPMTPGGIGTPSYSRMTSTASNSEYYNSNTYQLKQLQQLQQASESMHSVFIEATDNSSSIIWSPHNEIAATTSTIPLTPTAPLILPPSNNNQLLGVTGSSPPEAAVEATPETTPLKDIREFKQQTINAALANSPAVRAIFANSQPSSPMRKEQQSQFNFPDVSTAEDSISLITSATTTTTTTATTLVEHVTRVSTYDRRLQQVIQDRNMYAQSPYLTINRSDSSQSSNMLPNSLPEINAVGVCVGPIFGTKDFSTVCGDCNETDRSMCSAGGLHMPTSRSVQQLANGIKRRNRNATYCCTDSSCESTDGIMVIKQATISTFSRDNQMRRTKSCSALSTLLDMGSSDETDCGGQRHANGTTLKFGIQQTQKTGSRLQRSGKILAMVPSKAQTTDEKLYANAGTQTLEGMPLYYENALFELLFEGKEMRVKYERSLVYPQDILEKYIARSINSNENFDAEQSQLMCLQLDYERYRRNIHAERNRRLMGRSRDKRSLEMECDRLREQLKSFDDKNRALACNLDRGIKTANERATIKNEELAELKAKYQHEVEQNRCLRQANEDLQTRLNTEMQQRKEIDYEMQALNGRIFTLDTELMQAQQQATAGMQYKQELARLEAEFIIMGEVQVRCRDHLAETDNYRARHEELRMMQDSSKHELKKLKDSLEEKTSQLEGTKHKIIELQTQLTHSEKVITDQKRLLRNVKDEYEEMFKMLNKKYETQKKILIQMEEKLMMALHQPQGPFGHNTCSPDTDRTDIASSMDRNSPLSTSLASSESLSASLRSTELKNLQQLVETPSIPEVVSSTLYEDNARMPAIDLASSASTASAINIMHSTTTATLPHALDPPTTSSHIHTHPHLHLQQTQNPHILQEQQQPHHSKEPQKKMRL